MNVKENFKDWKMNISINGGIDIYTLLKEAYTTDNYKYKKEDGNFYIILQKSNIDFWLHMDVTPTLIKEPLCSGGYSYCVSLYIHNFNRAIICTIPNDEEIIKRINQIIDYEQKKAEENSWVKEVK